MQALCEPIIDAVPCIPGLISTPGFCFARVIKANVFATAQIIINRPEITSSWAQQIGSPPIFLSKAE